MLTSNLSKDQTVFLTAIKKNNISYINIKIGNKFDVCFADTNKSTPLHWAAYYGNKDILQKILVTMAEQQIFDWLNTQNSKGETALHLAIRHK